MTKLIIVPFLVFLQTSAYCQTNPEEKPPLKDPKVIERLDEMGKYLRSLKQFELNADVNFEALIEKDQKIDVYGDLHYKVKAPDKLWVQLETPHKIRQYFYDGDDFTVFAPDLKYYATAPAPNSISEFIDAVQEKFNIEMPLSDLFDWGTDKGKLDQVTIAQFIEEFTEDNKKIDHYFIRQGKTDWQVWIPQGKSPLPQRIVYVSTDESLRPKFSSELSWKLNSKFNDKDFKFSPAKGNYKIDFVNSENNNGSQPETK